MRKTVISKMRIDMRTCELLFNHMSQKKMLDNKFVDTKRVSHLPAFPGSRRCHRKETRRSRRRRTGPMPQDTPLDPCRGTTACPSEPPLTWRVRAGLGGRKTL
jgi:hypothetical protein